MRVWLFLALLLPFYAGAAPVALTDLKGDALRQHLTADLKAIAAYRNGLTSTVRFVKSRNDLFPSTKLAQARDLSREEKEAIRVTWKTFLDYQLALDSLRKFSRDFYLLTGDARRLAFLARYSSFLAGYSSALEFIDRADMDPGFRKILNEPVPELGLPAGTYDQIRTRYLSVERAAEFSAMDMYFKTISCTSDSVCPGIKQDADSLWRMGKGKGELMTLKASFDLLEKTGYDVYFPVQAGVAEWMGDVKVARKNQSLISHEQVERVLDVIQPGDILFVRREWYLSNIGLPGFWPHAALYIGSPEERKKYFDDPEVKNWLQTEGWTEGDFEDLLKARNEKAYQTSLQRQAGHRVRVMEAMSEGVSFTALEHCMDADSAAVVRPKLSKREKAIALLRAFHYAGRPYDFNFDFLTDSELVCSELVYKCYEPATGYAGMHFPLLEILGRKATPPNEMVRQFDEEYGGQQQQADFVLFLDGVEGAGKAVESTLEKFRQSWTRPKWYIVTQMKPENDH